MPNIDKVHLTNRKESMVIAILKQIARLLYYITKIKFLRTFYVFKDDNNTVVIELQNTNCNFINLVNKTSFLVLAKILKLSNCLISIDPRTMHLGCLLDMIYRAKVIKEKQSVDNIYNELIESLQCRVKSI